VETAIVLPLVMALLLGIFTGASAYSTKIGLVDAARDGARYGASLKVPTGGLASWRLSVRNRVVQLSDGGISAADVCADLVVPTGSDTSCGVADPSGAAGDTVAAGPASVVKVSVAKPATLDFLFLHMTPTLAAHIAARYERDIL
jgi:hypothetical protein